MVSPPFSDGFEAYSSNTPLTTLSASGWSASSATVTVQPSNAIPVSAGTNAVLMPVKTTASNLVNSATPTKVWTDLRYNEALHMLDVITVDVDTNAVFQFYMTTNGAVTVYDRAVGDWVSYSTDVWGNAVSGFSAVGWNRVSVCKDYTTRKAAVFLNGHPIRIQLDFINTSRSTYGGFTVKGSVDNPSYLDEVGVQATLPAGLTADIDADGVADAQEIQDYGRLDAWGSTVSNSISLTVANVTNANLLITGGVTLTVTAPGLVIPGTLTLAAGNVLVVSNGSVTGVSLVIGAGSTVRAYNSTVSLNGVVMTGDFTLDSTWGTATVTPSQLNFSDDFERYGLNTRLDALGLFGWKAASASILVQSNITYLASARAVILPGDWTTLPVVTNVISAAGLSNIWTEYSYNEPTHVQAEGLVDTSAVAQLYLNTNCFLVLYNRGVAQWEVCSNDAWGASLSGVYTSGWARIALNQNYATKKVAVFLNGRLVREQFDFINTNQTSYVRFQVNGSDRASSYLDSVSFSTNVPTSLLSGPASDLDRDGIPDAEEVAQYGSVLLWPHGSIFKIR